MEGSTGRPEVQGMSKFSYLKALHGVQFTHAEYRILVTVLDYAGGKTLTRAHPGVERLAEDVCMDPRSVRRALASLRSRGYLRITKPAYWRDGRRMADEYALTLPAVARSGLRSPEVRTEESGGADSSVPPSDHVPDQVSDPPPAIAASPAGDADSSLREPHAPREAPDRSALVRATIEMHQDDCEAPDDFLDIFEQHYPALADFAGHLIENLWGPDETTERISAEIRKASARGVRDPTWYGAHVFATSILPGICQTSVLAA